MKSLQEFICYNQKQLIKFEYTVSELHKTLKDLMREGKPNLTELEKAYDKLGAESFMLMNSIFEKNAEFISNTIGLKDDKLRFSIKVVEEQYVIDLFRNHNLESFFHESLYSENSAFDQIMNFNAKYYINNDIEKSYLDGNYKNPRLKKDTPWEKAWKEYNSVNISNQFYNSTLVIPISITVYELDKDTLFYNKYFEQNNDTKINTKTRAIWGFVCFDSKQRNYFDEQSNLDLGFIIADILSLYVIFYYNFAISSKTVLDYEEKYI